MISFKNTVMKIHITIGYTQIECAYRGKFTDLY